MQLPADLERMRTDAAFDRTLLQGQLALVIHGLWMLVAINVLAAMALLLLIGLQPGEITHGLPRAMMSCTLGAATAVVAMLFAYVFQSLAREAPTRARRVAALLRCAAIGCACWSIADFVFASAWPPAPSGSGKCASRSSKNDPHDKGARVGQ